MTNTNKLKAKMAERGLNIKKLAENINMSNATLSQKLSGKVKFFQDDIRKIDKELNLTSDELKEIFFSS